MKTPSFIRLIIRATAVSALLFVTACQKDFSAPGDDKGNSSVHVFLTDDPSLVAEHLFLEIRKLEIKVEDNDSADDHGHHNGGDDNTADDSHGNGRDDGSDHDANDDRNNDTTGDWISVDVNAGIYDILRFRNGLDTLFGKTSFSSTRRLTKIRLTLGQNNSAVLNGDTVALELTDKDHFLVIGIDEAQVEIKNGGRTDLWLDIDAGQSLRQHGDRLQLKLKGKAFSKNKNGSIEGIVLPFTARPIVLAINGTDTATAKAEDSGEFKFIGLKAGTYTVIYHATGGAFADYVLPAVSVTGKEDIHLPSVTLHP